MRTFLLLAGQSTRFRPLREKTLFPIAGQTLLEHQLHRLRQSGIDDITLVGGHHNLAEAARIAPDLPRVEQEDLSLGMQGALLSALRGIHGPVCIVSGNDVIDPAGYRAVLDAVRDGADGALLCKRMPTYFPGGYVTVADGRITSIVEKPGDGNQPSDLVNIVAHAHGDAALLRGILERIHSDRDDGYEQALAELFGSARYSAVAYEGPWFPVKYPWHLLALTAHILDSLTSPHIHPTAAIHPSAVVEGPVHIGEGSRVLAHATVVGPCTIGARCIVANNALVRGSSIGDDCVVGYATEICRSVLHSHVWTHMAYIGDSIVGRNVSFGGGCVTGNLRLDEREEVTSVVGSQKIATGLRKCGAIVGDDCRLGIHVSMAPGVKIGAGSFIGSAALVESDIPERQFARMKNGVLELRENRTAAPQPEDRATFRSAMESSDASA